MTDQPAPNPPTEDTGLTDLHLEMLAFERTWWKHVGARDSAISEKFGMTPVRYFQILNSIIDRPQALEADPMLVRRLLRLRDERARQRTARRGQLG